jgi:CBS domain-containing protein
VASIQSRVRRNVIAVDESASCAEAARVMAEHGIGSIGVRRCGKLVGIVTSREILRGITAGLDARSTPVAAALRPDAPTISAQASDDECAELMRRWWTGHIAVEEGGDIVGVISLLDLSDLRVDDRGSSISHRPRRLRADRVQELAFDPMGLVPTGIQPREHAEQLSIVGRHRAA